MGRNAIVCFVICCLCCLCCLLSTSLAGPPADDAWIAGLEGGWSGDDNMTPMGRMPFVVLFDREQDGSLHSHTAQNRETWVDLHFRKDEQGRWLLDESAGMEGLGVQRYTLEPVEAPGDLRRWVWTDKPGFLSVDMGLADGRMFMKVLLRGEDHVQFDLARMPDEALPELRRGLAENAKRAPETNPYRALANDDTVPEGIREARQAIAAAPHDAKARLQLAAAVQEQLQADPMTAGPRYAGEMLEALQTALELDPKDPQAYHWLVGYYLNAPPIAGGSVDKAEQVARQLIEIDADGGAQLLASIEQRQSGNTRHH